MGLFLGSWAAASKIAAEYREGLVEKRDTALLSILHACQQLPEALQDSTLDLFQLLDSVRVAAVMREVVVLGIDAIDDS